jgi:hypothetical protein
LRWNSTSDSAAPARRCMKWGKMWGQCNCQWDVWVGGWAGCCAGCERLVLDIRGGEATSFSRKMRLCVFVWLFASQRGFFKIDLGGVAPLELCALWQLAQEQYPLPCGKLLAVCLRGPTCFSLPFRRLCWQVQHLDCFM